MDELDRPAIEASAETESWFRYLLSTCAAANGAALATLMLGLASLSNPANLAQDLRPALVLFSVGVIASPAALIIYYFLLRLQTDLKLLIAPLAKAERRLDTEQSVDAAAAVFTEREHLRPRLRRTVLPSHLRIVVEMLAIAGGVSFAAGIISVLVAFSPEALQAATATS